jgi:peptidoglycan/xylan/chitin deacetylase (PgdA/CDA1 family)
MRPDELMGPKFLLYHDVVDAAGGDERRAKDAIARHFDYLASLGYRFARMSDFVAGVPLSSRDVVVTVDDGSRTFVDCMLPVLREHRAPALLFLVSGFAGRNGTRQSFLSWDEARALVAEEAVEVGSHCATHVPLDQLDEVAMRREVEDGRAAMLAEGLEPLTLAYPFGHFNDATKHAVEDAGFSAAFSVYKGGWDRFEIRRRMFSGLEGPAFIRMWMSDHFFGVREALRRPVPDRFLKHEAPVSTERWGARNFGVPDDDGTAVGS